MNAPLKSKINYTGLVIAIIGVVASLDLMPPKMEEHLVEIAMILTGPLVIVFRTYFTGNKDA